MNKSRIAALTAALMALGAAQSAKAVTIIGAKLNVMGGPDRPTFTLTNTSNAPSQLEWIELLIGPLYTVGDPQGYNWDKVTNLSVIADTGAPLTAMVDRPDQVDGGQRSNLLRVSFAGFDTGDAVSFDAELDKGLAETAEDYHQVLFRSEWLDPPRAYWNAFLAGPDSYGGESHFWRGGSFWVPERSTATSYDFSSAAAVPLPSTLPLLGAGTAMLGLLRRKRPW